MGRRFEWRDALVSLPGRDYGRLRRAQKILPMMNDFRPRPAEPRGRKVCSSPSCRASLRRQASPPNGWPRVTARRIASNSVSLCASVDVIAPSPAQRDGRLGQLRGQRFRRRCAAWGNNRAFYRRAEGAPLHSAAPPRPKRRWTWSRMHRLVRQLLPGPHLTHPVLQRPISRPDSK